MAENFDENEPALEPPTYESLFTAYSKFGPHSDENVDGILLSQADLWLKQAKILCDTITLTDTGMHFIKFKKLRLTFDEFQLFLLDLCDIKNLNISDIKEKLYHAGSPTLAPKIV